MEVCDDNGRVSGKQRAALKDDALELATRSDDSLVSTLRRAREYHEFIMSGECDPGEKYIEKD
jgi:hypothetical protein